MKLRSLSLRFYMVFLFSLMSYIGVPISVNAQLVDADWCYGFDFQLQSYSTIGAFSGWYTPSWGNGWVSGQGWQSEANGGSQQLNYLQLDFPIDVDVTNINYDLYSPLNQTSAYASWSPSVGITSYLNGASTILYNVDVSNTAITGQYWWDVVSPVVMDRVRLASNPLVTSSYYITGVRIHGMGTEPFPSMTNNCLPATPTPVPTNTPIATIEVGEDFNSNVLCPPVPVNSSEVSIAYASQCSHCLSYEDELTPQATSIFPTSTLDPALPTNTPVWTTDEITPVAQTATPVPTATPDYEGSVQIQLNSPNVNKLNGTIVGDDVVYADVEADGTWYRMVRFEVAVPKIDGELVHINTIFLRVFAENYIVNPEDFNSWIVAKDAYGQVVFESTYWNSYMPSNTSIDVEFSPLDWGYPQDGIAVMEIAVIVDKDGVDQAYLDGGLNVSYIVFNYNLGWQTGGSSDSGFLDSMFPDSICYSPENYPASSFLASDVFDFSLLSVPDFANCYTLSPYINLDGALGVLPFGDDAVEIPALQLCVHWIQLGRMVIFGIPINVGMILSFFVIIYLFRKLFEV